MTPAESVLWSRLRRGALGVRFRRQEPIGPFVVDFVARRVRLVVELDGAPHYAGDGTADAARDATLCAWGFRVLRAENVVVFNQLDDLLAEVARLVSDPHATPVDFS